MKKFTVMLLMICLTTIMVSCKKEKKECNCGIITNDNIEFDTNNNMLYSLTIKNDCSGNSGKYYFTHAVWFEAHVGEYFCITNVSSWMPIGETIIQEVENKNKN